MLFDQSPTILSLYSPLYEYVIPKDDAVNSRYFLCVLKRVTVRAEGQKKKNGDRAETKKRTGPRPAMDLVVLILYDPEIL